MMIVDGFIDDYAASKGMKPTDDEGNLDPKGAAKRARHMAGKTGDDETDAVLEAAKEVIENIQKADGHMSTGRSARDAGEMDKAIALRPGVVDTAMQVVIRETGAGGMPPEEHARFLRYHRDGELIPPDVVGRATAVLALHAPGEWSGSFLRWNDDQVQALVKEYAP